MLLILERERMTSSSSHFLINDLWDSRKIKHTATETYDSCLSEEEGKRRLHLKQNPTRLQPTFDCFCAARRSVHHVAFRMKVKFSINLHCDVRPSNAPVGLLSASDGGERNVNPTLMPAATA